MIAGLPQAPSEYNPFLNPKAALQRRNEVLLAMEQQGYISPRRLRRGLAARPRPGPRPQVRDDPRAVLLRLRAAAADRQVRGQHGPQRRAQGLHDDQPRSCRRTPSARSTRAPSATREEDRPRRSPRSTPTNGHILAMASSQPYSPTSQFNFAADAHRQPGSSFKPYVLAAAISQGMNPDTTYYSGASPMTLTLPDGTPPGPSTTPSRAAGIMDVRKATIDSVNVVFAQLDLDVGPENVRKTAYELRDHDPPRRHPGRGHRRPAARGHPARAGGRLRDVRRRRRAPLGDRDRQGRVPQRRHRHARRGQQLEGVLRRDRLRGDRHPQGRDHRGDRVPATRTSAAPPPARPAPPRASPTPGSSATRRRISTAVWVGHPNPAPAPASAARLPGRSGTSYMEAAHGSYCDDFPPPQNPVQFSSSGAARTPSPRPARRSSSGAGTSTPAPPSGTGGYNGKYPPSLYAPGAGQGPAPTPRGQRRRRRAASGQLRRRRRRRRARAHPERVGRSASVFGGGHSPRLADPVGLRSARLDLHGSASAAPAARIRHRRAARR